MVLYQKPVKSKAGTGGRKKSYKDKRLAHYGGFQALTKLAKGKKEHREVTRTKGGGIKVKPKSVEYANVFTDGKTKKVKITNVVETPSNRHYARENVIVKGALIETELGKARVTNRVGQDGVVNAVLVAKT